MPQGVLYLQREEGGQGLIHQASKTAAFRLQLIQRFLTGPTDLVWRNVASCHIPPREVSHVGLDTAVLIDCIFFFFKYGAFSNAASKNPPLFWLLKETLIYGLDVSSGALPSLPKVQIKNCGPAGPHSLYRSGPQ